MKLFSLTRGGQLKPLWSHTVRGVIWRLVPAGNSRFVGEARDLDKKSTTFFCLDRTTGNPFWEDLSFEEKWWIGIECVTGGVLILHTFATPDLPVHKGIIAVDLENGRHLWSSRDLTYVSADEGRLVALLTKDRLDSPVEIEARTGNITRHLQSGEVQSSGKVAAPDSEFQSSVPLVRGEVSRAGEILRLSRRGTKGTGAVEVIDGSPYVVYSQLEPAGRRTDDREVLTNTVFVLEAESGREVFADILRSDARASAPEQVLVQSGSLYYIREGHTIASVPLPGWRSA